MSASSTLPAGGGNAAERLGGFLPDRFVAGSFNDNLLCSICRYVFDNPVLTPCGHLFCASCLSHWLTACQTLLPSCPECRRTVFAFDVRPVRGLRNYIASLPTYCSLRRHGCNTVLPLEQIQGHEDTCQHKSSPPLTNATNSNSNNNEPSRTSRSNRTKQPPPSSIMSSQQQHSSSRSSRSSATLVSNHQSSTLPRNRTSLATRTSNTSVTVVDHRPNARQRIATANQQNQRSAYHQTTPSLSLNDRVARLEEKLQQVRLDIEAAEQRNVWLETQLALARNNLSLADALRRVRATPSGNNSSSSASAISRRRPATHSFGTSDD